MSVSRRYKIRVSLFKFLINMLSVSSLVSIIASGPHSLEKSCLRSLTRNMSSVRFSLFNKCEEELLTSKAT